MPSSPDDRLASPANPGAAGTATLLDTTLGPKADGTQVTLAQRCAKLHVKRVEVCVTVDQNATFFTDWLDPTSTTWRTYNGNGAGEPITASTPFQRSVKCVGLDTRIRIVTVTAPTLWEVMGRVSRDQALGQ